MQVSTCLVLVEYRVHLFYLFILFIYSIYLFYVFILFIYFYFIYSIYLFLLYLFYFIIYLITYVFERAYLCTYAYGPVLNQVQQLVSPQDRLVCLVAKSNAI